MNINLEPPTVERTPESFAEFGRWSEEWLQMFATVEVDQNLLVAGLGFVGSDIKPEELQHDWIAAFTEAFIDARNARNPRFPEDLRAPTPTPDHRDSEQTDSNQDVS